MIQLTVEKIVRMRMLPVASIEESLINRRDLLLIIILFKHYLAFEIEYQFCGNGNIFIL